jgi:hypothetical protein
LDIPLLDLKIHQKEGEVASARLVVPQGVPFPSDRWITLWYRNQQRDVPLFRGRPVGIPSVLNEYTKKVELLAIPVDADQQHQSLIETLKTEGYVDGRFIDATHRFNPSEYLEATPQLFCYHRVTHRITLSTLFEGRETLVLKDQILSDGLVFRLTDSPLSGVRLILSKEWVQTAEGDINVMPLLKACFSKGLINTLTPRSLLDTWPQTGQLLGRSGYAVVHSSLSKIQPNRLGYEGGFYPTVTPLIQGERFERFWLEGDLAVSWQYRQRRREIVTVDVDQETQLLSVQAKAPRVIRLGLHPGEGEEVQERFFDTPQGQSALRHALKIAQCHLAYSARAAELTVEIPFEEGLGLHLDQSAEVHHDSLPGKKVRGKMVAYALEITKGKALASVRIALSVGKGMFEEEGVSVQGLEPEGLIRPEEMEPKDFIDSLNLSNTTEEQIEHLQKCEDPTQASSELATKIHIHFKDLRSHDVLERHLGVKARKWSAPQQIFMD